MNAKEIIELILGSGGLISVIFLIFKMGRFAQKIDTLGQNIEDAKKDTDKNFSDMKTEISKNLSDMKTDIKEIRTSIYSMEVQIGKLETRVEERTLRVVKDNYKPEPAVR